MLAMSTAVAVVLSCRLLYTPRQCLTRFGTCNGQAMRAQLHSFLCLGEQLLAVVPQWCRAVDLIIQQQSQSSTSIIRTVDSSRLAVGDKHHGRALVAQAPTYINTKPSQLLLGAKTRS